MENILTLDKKLFLAINGAWNPYLDPVMEILSAVRIWFTLYLAIAVIVFFRKCYATKCGGYAVRREIRRGKFFLAGMAAVLFCIVGYLACDWGSNLVKALVQRPRPGFDLATAIGRFPTGKGSPYGFFSAHAANTFCFALLSSSILGSRLLRWSLILWACLVSYSRIYLGYHFPLDVVVGIIWGLCVAILLRRIFKFVIRKIAEAYPKTR